MFDVWFTLFALAFCCRFLFRLILNKKTFLGILGILCFSAPLQQMYYLFTFRFLAFPFVLIVQKKTKTEMKKTYFCHFCPKMSVFVANKVLIFSVLYVCRANCTPPPRFWHSQGRSALFRKFLFFIFYFFCKILRFFQFSFSTEF